MLATQPTKKLRRYKPHQKYFLKDGTKVPGASTIAKYGPQSESLINWVKNCYKNGLDPDKIRDEAAGVGSIAHFFMQGYLEEFEPDVSDYPVSWIKQAEPLYFRLRGWWEEQDLTLVESESQMVSEKYRFGGTSDVVARNKDGRLILIDFKTSKGVYDEHRFQVSAYEELLYENKEEEVYKIWIVQAGKDGSFNDEELKHPDKYFEVFLSQLNTYYKIQNLK